MSYFSVKSKFDSLADKARMSVITDEVSRISNLVRTFPAEIEKIRTRGYSFASYLEKKAEVLQDHWDEIRRRVEDAIDREANDLRNDLELTERHMTKAEKLEDNEEKLEQVLPQVEEVVDKLEELVEAAEERIRTLYENLKSDIDQTESSLHKINWYCDMKDEASFDFLAGEALFMVADAEWTQTGKGNKDPDGILYLTDQRLVFEQKEKVGKKLGLFGGKNVQEVELDLPLHQIENIEPENKGMFGGKDMLNFTLKGGAPYANLTIEVKGGVDCKFWAKQIERMISGDTKDERAIQPDPELVEQLRNAPSECHVCGGTLPMLVAGQNQVSCAYCGTVIRI